MNRLEKPANEIILYQSPDGEINIEVRLERETVWLTQRQMADLFDTSTDNVGLHLKNIFNEGELAESTTTEDYSVVQSEGGRQVRRQLKHYNLDAIISVGYRVSSKRGTQFRIWATRTLRDYLLKGYTLNEQRLREKGFDEIGQAVSLLSRTLTRNELVSSEGRAAIEIVEQYTRAWKLLLQYDEEKLAETPEHPVQPAVSLSMADANAAIAGLRIVLYERGEATDIFGQERGDHLGAILGALEQTFDGQPLYPTAQARAANLLYLVIKDHPFVDGNKRIGTLLFLEYLRRNGLLLRPDGQPRLADNAIVALALLVAESDARQKELMIRLILNLIEDEAQ
ncbi:MAG: RhuM family protein [Thermoleophilia bacterium]